MYFLDVWLHIQNVAAAHLCDVLDVFFYPISLLDVLPDFLGGDLEQFHDRLIRLRRRKHSEYLE